MEDSAGGEKVMPAFERMPRMYLELLENKDKIRPGLVNKEYDPDDAQSVYSFDLNASSSHKPSSSSAAANPRPEVIEEEEDDVSRDEDDASDTASGGSVADEEEDEEESRHDEASQSSKSSSSRDSFVPREERSVYSSPSSQSQRSFHQPLSSKEEEVKNKTKQKLKDLLFSEDGGKDVPTLAELQKRGEVKDTKVIADLGRMGRMDTLEEEDELKRELLFKFELLKKSYKHANIPEFTMHSDYRNMNQTYENTLRQVSLDSSVEGYKSLLVGGFMLLEFILGFWLKFDMSGFTQQQVLNMNQYERLLIELGEKSYVPGGSQWPVELRLLGLIVMNAIIFIISKMILKKTGSNLVGLMNSVNTVMGAPNQKPKRRMRGPTVDLESIPDVGDEDSD
jgi:hypothetical protein